MATTYFNDGVNSGFQAGVINGNVGNVTIGLVQSETLNQACLRDLRTTNPHDDKERIKNASGGLLKDSYRWILDNKEFKQWQNEPSNRLLWIKGDPGKGKTMLLCGIIEELTQLHGNTANISFFFCQATDTRINNATSVLRGLIYSLVEKNPSLLSYVRAQYDHTGRTLFEDTNAWNALSMIFTSILKDKSLKSTYLIIDALDECVSGLRYLLDFIIQESPAHSQIKWIVSSRDWPEIEERLNIATQIGPISLELNEAYISEAVHRFIQHKVDYLAKVKKYKDETREVIYRHLLLNAQGTFLWVALVCENLDRTPPRHAIKKLQAFPSGLDALYSRMIDQVRGSEDAELCKQILATLSTVYRPPTLKELTALIEVPGDSYDDDSFLEVIRVCGSFLTLRGDTVMFVHQSAKDFLLRGALNEILPRGIEAEHHAIFTRSLNVIFETLRRDIFDLKLPGIPATDISKPSPSPLGAAEYACVYWVDHLQDSAHDQYYELSLNDKGRVDAFLQQKYLHWLEALSIIGSVSDGIKAMKKLEVLIKRKSKSEALLHRAQDAFRFIRYHKTGIESSPLQVYYSPLVFSPTKSSTRLTFQEERPYWISHNSVMEENWSLCLQTLEGHSGSVLSIAWSPDGSRLASASADNTARIWDPATGQSLSTLEGHSRSISLIAWSPDGRQLASMSYDNTVRIWSPATGQSVYTLEGHREAVTSIAWSPDGSRLASASADNIVSIWDPATGRGLSTLQGHRKVVTLIAWSPDGSQLASASYDKKARIWDPATSQIESTLKGHRGFISWIAWSPDGRQLASASYDRTVKIWDPVTSQCLSTLEGHSRSVRSVAWSADGRQLASASDDGTFRIWDLATSWSKSTIEGHSGSIGSIAYRADGGQLDSNTDAWVRRQDESTFEGHDTSFVKIAWSPDGSRLAASAKNEVRIWDKTTGQCTAILKGHRGSVNLITWSPDGSQIASASKDMTVRIWDPATTATSQSESTFQGRSTSILRLSWSPDESQLASASFDNIVRIWDPATSQCMSTLEGHEEWVNLITWSLDGSRLASVSYEIVKIWDPATGQCTLTLEGHSRSVSSIAWSPDGSRLASASEDKTVNIWDLANGQCTLTLEGHGHSIRSIAWSIDARRLASASNDTVRIWDTATGQCTLTLGGHGHSVSSIAWSPDESRLASASEDKTVNIWDLANGQCTLTLEGHGDSIRSIAWSIDGRRLAAASNDKTVRIWDTAIGLCESTIRIGYSNFLQFDKVNLNKLHTSMGTFDTGFTHHSTLPEQYGYGLNDDHSWITYNGVNLFWLPVDYRPLKPLPFAISATNLAIACLSGIVIFRQPIEQSTIPGF